MKERRDVTLLESKYLRIWHTFDSFGFSLILNIDYWNLILRIGTIVFCIGR